MNDASLPMVLDGRKAWLGSALLAAAFLAVALFTFGASLGRHQYDDAYITYRYAANLAEGKGYAFNPGERWNAASSPLYTLGLAALYRLGFTRLELAGSLIGLTSGCLALATAWILALRWLRRPWIGFLALLAAAMSGPMAVWAVNGMEAVLFLALILAALLRLDQGAKEGELAIWLGLATLCRLEGLALAPALALGVWIRGGGKAGALRILALGLAPLAAWLLFCRLYFGEALPESFLFKRYFFYYRWSPSYCLINAGYQLKTQGVQLACLFAASLGALAGIQARRPAWIALLCCSLAGLLEVLAGPASDFFRYGLFLAPMLALATGMAADWLWERGLGARLTVALLLAILGYQGYESLGSHWAFFPAMSDVQGHREEVGAWLDAHADSGDLVLSQDLGIIAWRARRLRFVDSTGLCSPPVLDLVRSGDVDLLAAIARLKPRFVADTCQGSAPSSLTALREPRSVFFYPPSARPRLPLPAFKSRAVAVNSAYGLCILELKWDPAPE